MSEQQLTSNALRVAAAMIRRSSMPLSELIPLLQKAADLLDQQPTLEPSEQLDFQHVERLLLIDPHSDSRAHEYASAARSLLVLLKRRTPQPPSECCTRCHCQERAQKFLGDPRLGVFAGPQKCSVCDKVWGPFPCMRADCAFHPRATSTKGSAT